MVSPVDSSMQEMEIERDEPTVEVEMDGVGNSDQGQEQGSEHVGVDMEGVDLVHPAPVTNI